MRKKAPENSRSPLKGKNPLKKGQLYYFLDVENPRRGRQARNFTTNVPKILDLKSSSEQIFFENCRRVPLKLATEIRRHTAGAEAVVFRPFYERLL